MNPALATPRRQDLKEIPVNKALKFAIMFSAATFVASLPALAGGGVDGRTTVPEPITLALLATGIGAVAVVRKLRDK
jgi:hypothetical protein